MNAAPRRIWRPLRSFLILICVGGAVLAADNTWLTDLRFDFNAADWWSNFSPAETPNADMAIVAEPANHRAPELSMGQLLHGLLFSKPSSSWRLEPGKTEVTSAWMTQQSGGTFTSLSRSDYFQPSFSPAGFVTSAGLIAPAAPTSTDGIWALNSSGNWSTSTNWAGGSVADGAGATADFSQFDLTNNIVVTLDSSRTIGSLYIGDSNGTNTYDIAPQSGSTLTFDSGNPSTAGVLQQTSSSAGDTISANIFFKNDFNINNVSTTHPFTIGGDIASSQTNSFPTLSFNANVGTPGEIRVTGKITDGSTGSRVSVSVNGGTVLFSGANNYTGSTFVEGGTLLVNGNAANAIGLVQVSGSGSVLGGTITGNTITTVGTLTLLNNVILNTGEGPGGTYLANLSASLSDLLAITGSLTLGAGTTLDIVGSADNLTTYTLATFASRSGIFATVTGIPSGYSLVYNNTDIELVPTAIPEPSTWIGGALALGAIGFAFRRRLRAAVVTLL
ncbi:MAG: PEP-CTERM sorting domain-containing protein [Chthoniobacterales bacterium]